MKAFTSGFNAAINHHRPLYSPVFKPVAACTSRTLWQYRDEQPPLADSPHQSFPARPGSHRNGEPRPQTLPRHGRAASALAGLSCVNFGAPNSSVSGRCDKAHALSARKTQIGTLRTVIGCQRDDELRHPAEPFIHLLLHPRFRHPPARIATSSACPSTERPSSRKCSTPRESTDPLLPNAGGQGCRGRPHRSGCADSATRQRHWRALC